ncbi:MAG: DnaJ family molecular chaperone [Pseudomonadota bacterium]
MSVFSRMAEILVDGVTNAVAATIERVRTAFEGDPDTRARVAFSIAMIALSAKMAKADGIVTQDEVEAFQEIFDIPEQERSRVSRLYNLAKQDTAGFQAYARQLAELCGRSETGDSAHGDILDGLFHIAKADGIVHDKELAFLSEIATIFGIREEQFDAITARHVDKGDNDPWRILGLDPNSTMAQARRLYLDLVRRNHPDQMVARGVPPEFVRIADERMAVINAAWEAVEPVLAKTAKAS